MWMIGHTYFSLNYGTLPVKELLTQAQDLGYKTVVLTDVNNTSGMLDFLRQAPEFGIRALVGIEFQCKGKTLYWIIPKSLRGLEALNCFASGYFHSKTTPPPCPPEIPDVWVIYPFPYKNRALSAWERIGLMPEDFKQLPFSHWNTQQEHLVFWPSVFFRNQRDYNTHRLLRAIDLNVLLSKLPPEEQASKLRMLVPAEEYKKSLADYPHIQRQTQDLLLSCSVRFSFGDNKNKQRFLTTEQEDIQLLTQEAKKGLHYRFPSLSAEVEQRFYHELDLIVELGFTSYFLINWDLIRYAKSKSYFHVGRGSGANSLVAYCLGITDVDPVDLDLYFERFINRSRKNPPDFDIDFSWTDRDEITQYIFNKYGTEHAVLLSAYSTYKKRAMFRELGKVFGLPKEEIDALIINYQKKAPPHELGALVYKYGKWIEGFPSHLTVHSCGILISEKPIFQYTATFMPPKGYPTTQFSMVEAEDLGLHKFDILSQRGLGHIRDAVQLVKANKGVSIDIHQIQAFKEDARVRKNLGKGNTLGCFYIESPAMRQLLRKLEAKTYRDLVAASSIIRPGVSQSGMMREYIERYRNPEKRKYIHPKLGELMAETFGVMVYQEDVLKVAHYFAGLTLEEADILRRGMSWKFRERNEFASIQNKFFSNCKAKGYALHVTEEVWRQIESFGNYAFAKGHSASYAVESYQSLFLKTYYPLEFYVAVINNFGGFYSTEVYLHEAKMCGANIEPPCLNNSEKLTTLRASTIYMGFVHMKGLESKTTSKILHEREQEGPFIDLNDLVERVSISLEQLILLIRANALRQINPNQAQLLWKAHFLLGRSKKSDPQDTLFKARPKSFSLPELELEQRVLALNQVELFGFPLISPFLLIDAGVTQDIHVPEFPENVGKRVRMAGYLIHVKKTSTQNKFAQVMSFGTFIDGQGHMLDTVHFPQSLRQFPFRGRGVYQLDGVVTEDFGAFSLEVKAMEKIPWLGSEVKKVS